MILLCPLSVYTSSPGFESYRGTIMKTSAPRTQLMTFVTRSTLNSSTTSLNLARANLLRGTGNYLNTYWHLSNGLNSTDARPNPARPDTDHTRVGKGEEKGSPPDISVESRRGEGK